MRSYSHLSEDERDQIGVLRAAGRSMGAIARALGRANDRLRCRGSTFTLDRLRPRQAPWLPPRCGDRSVQ